MSVKYADIIIDISQTNVDKPFRYRIPEELLESGKVGAVVKGPFGKGNRIRTGYVIGLADEANYDIDKIKSIDMVVTNAVSVESALIRLAEWMRESYGCTMITALNTVMPVKKVVKERKSQIDIRENIPEFRPIDELEEDQQRALDSFISDLENGKSTAELGKAIYLANLLGLDCSLTARN
mgnify:CR=1 FL=1